MVKTRNFISDEHQILGDKARVLRTSQSGGVWQFRMRISAEKKYIRESLKTRDLETALSRAEDRVLEVLSDIRSGRKIFGLTLQELVESYLAWRQADVEHGTITNGRFVTLKSQLKHILAFKSGAFRISELDRNACYDYANWRRTQTPIVKDVTLRNEQSTINHLMRFAYREGVSHFDGFEFRKLKIREQGRRDVFDLDEYDKLVLFLRTWTSKKTNKDNEDERQVRLLLRDAVLVASNTLLRVGELFQLKWGDVISLDIDEDERGGKIDLATLEIRSETSKVRKRRRIVTRGGEYLRRLKGRAQFTGDNHFVFSEDGVTRFSKAKQYNAWSEMMCGIDIPDYKSRNLTWYSLRHFGITCRLRAGANIYEVAKISGTSVAQIENHYGHFDDEMATAVAKKNFVVTRNGVQFRASNED